MKLLSLIFLILLSACGENDFKRFVAYRAPFTEQDLRPYVEKFRKEAEKRDVKLPTKTLTVKFDSKLESNSRNGVTILGRCSFLSGGNPLITINYFRWNFLTTAEKEQLVFHELGHCVLYDRHRPEYLDSPIENEISKVRGSLMNPYHMPESAYLKFYDYYIDEMFYPGKFDIKDYLSANNTFDIEYYSNYEYKEEVANNVRSKTRNTFSTVYSPESEVHDVEYTVECGHNH